MKKNLIKDCIFCYPPEERIVCKYKFFYVLEDLYPVTRFHYLIIPYRHEESYFNLTNEEINELHSIVNKEKKKLVNLDQTITAFNIGINIGKDAGQTIFHTHIHLIPRRYKDIKSPEGGVRGVIPNKRMYKTKKKLFKE